MNYREMFEAELDARNIVWCRGTEMRLPGGESYVGGTCGTRKSKGKHGTGSAWATQLSDDEPTVHFGGEIGTRHTLQIALHEVGHIVLGHTRLTESGRMKRTGKRVYETEQEAENWSFKRMRELGVPIPRKSRDRAKRYVAYKKRRGDRIIAAKRGAITAPSTRR